MSNPIYKDLPPVERKRDHDAEAAVRGIREGWID